MIFGGSSDWPALRTFLAAFLQQLYPCELTIYTPPMGHFALSWHQATFIHYTIVESHLELHLPHICSFNHSRSKTKDLSREKLVCIRSWWSVLAQVKALACYSWWLAAPRRSWWLKVFLPELAKDCGSPKKVVRGLSSTTPGWWTETLSERPRLGDMGGDKTLSECHNVD